MKTARLSVIQIVRQTIQFSWSNKSDIVYSLKYPLSFILATSIISSFIKNEYIGLIVTVLYMLFYTVFAVLCHRVVLLNELSGNITDILKLKIRYIKFFINLLAISFISGILIIPAFGLAEIIAPRFFEPDPNYIKFYSTVLLLSVPSGYVFSRLSLILPAVAIGNDINLSFLWSLSSRNGWKLFILIVFLPALINYVLDHINQSNLFMNILMALVNLLLLIFEIMIITYSYKELSKTGEEI